MANCRCNNKTRIVSNAVATMNQSNCRCNDVCTNPICGDPKQLSIMAPLIYDEIGINLCASFAIGTAIPTTYPTATNATISVIDISFANGATGVNIESIPGRPNCYLVTMTQITVTFALNLYDSSCRLLATLYPTAVYLPTDTTAATYNADTNPSSVELEIFAPYGVAYDTTGTAPVTPTPIVNPIGFSSTSNRISQGVNVYGIAKLLNFDATESLITVGVTFVVQSLYYAGYKVASAGKIDIPKGSIIENNNSDCMKFVAGDLLNLTIKPLDLGAPYNEECLKNECGNPTVDTCSSCTNCNNSTTPSNGSSLT